MPRLFLKGYIHWFTTVKRRAYPMNLKTRLDKLLHSPWQRTDNSDLVYSHYSVLTKPRPQSSCLRPHWPGNNYTLPMQQFMCAGLHLTLFYFTFAKIVIWNQLLKKERLIHTPGHYFGFVRQMIIHYAFSYIRRGYSAIVICNSRVKRNQYALKCSGSCLDDLHKSREQSRLRKYVIPQGNSHALFLLLFLFEETNNSIHSKIAKMNFFLFRKPAFFRPSGGLMPLCNLQGKKLWFFHSPHTNIQSSNYALGWSVHLPNLFEISKHFSFR